MSRHHLAIPFASGLAIAGGAVAQTNGWGPIYDTAALGPGQAACWSEGENTACLLLTCRNDGPFEIGLLAIGGGFGFGAQVPVFIRVDGGPLRELSMEPIGFSDYQHAAVAYDPELHGELLDELRTGSWASIALSDPDENPLPYPLGNRPEAVDAAVSACAATGTLRTQAGDANVSEPAAERHPRTEKGGRRAAP